MSPLWPIALVTFKEGIRSRAIYGITLFALLLLVANLLISGMIMQEVGKVAVDMALSAVSISGLLLVLFVGMNLISKDLDKRTIYMVLSRPISRSQYIAGKFFGVILLLFVAMLFLSVFAAVSILLVKLSHPNYFARFSWGLVSMGFLYNFLSLMLLSALSFLFASLTSTSFIALVMTVITYIIGNSINDVKVLLETPQETGVKVSSLTLKVIQGAYYVFPNLSLFDIKTQVAHGLALSGYYIFWSVLYCVVYTSLAIFLAMLAFKRREFP